MGLTREQNKAYKKDNGIGTTVWAKMVGNNGLSFKHTARTHDKFAKEIFELAYATGDPKVMLAAKECIAQMPKGARKGDITGYTADCRAVLNEFKGSLEHGIIEETVVAHEEASEERHQEGEVAADLRAANSDSITVKTGKNTVSAINANTDARAKEINKNVDQEGAATRRTVRQEGAATRRQVVETGNQITHDVTQNMSAITGVDADGFTEKGDDGKRLLSNGQAIADADSAVGQINKHTTEVGAQVTKDVNDNTTKEVNRGVNEVNKHTTAEAKETRLAGQRQAVLDAKRQTISDMLMNEVNESIPGAGHYRDSTVKWLGSAADRVMGDLDSDFATKKAALDELIRMVDEENVISDGDKEAFENKYLRHPEQVVREEPVDDRQIS